MNNLFVVEGGRTQVLGKQTFRNENILQDILKTFPECVALDNLGITEPFVVIGRDVATPAGKIDVLCIDGEGVLTIIETRLACNDQKRRELVGQIFEHVAQLSKWRAQDLVQAADSYLQSVSSPGESKGRTLFDLLKTKPGPGQEALTPEEKYEKIENNLRRGRVKVVIASDTIPDTLKDTAKYINSFSNLDIYILQVQSFKKDNLEIYAMNISEFAGKSGAALQEHSYWNEENFFNAIASLTQVKELFEFCNQNASEVRWGRGRVDGSFSFVAEVGMRKMTIFTVWSSGEITFNFGHMKGMINKETLDAFRNKLNLLPGVNLSEDVTAEGRYFTIGIKSLRKPEDLEVFKRAVKNLVGLY